MSDITQAPTQAAINKAIKQWARRYADEPDKLRQELHADVESIRLQNYGVEPDYGMVLTAYLRKLADEVSA